MRKPKVLIFARVSSISTRQDYDRQVNQLVDEAKRRNWQPTEIYAIKESATKKAREERKAYTDLIKLVQSGGFDKLLCKEVTRIGRRMSDNVLILEACNKAKVSILSVDQGTETLNPDGSPSMAGQLVFSIFSSIAEADSRQHRERIMSGLAEAKRKGIKSGRKEGSSETKEKFLCKHSKLVKAVKENPNLSIRKTAKLFDVSPNTVQKVKKLITT